MILGVLVGKKSYPFKKYLFVLMIVIGVILFMYKEKAGSTQSDGSIGLGELLIILSLTMDGLTGAVQVDTNRLNKAPILRISLKNYRNE